MSVRWLTLWIVVAVIALAARLGSYPLLDADEGRNGEVGREMAATNDYVVPHLAGLPYLDKPVVYFAAEAAVMEVLGPTEFAARFPAYLFTILTAAALFGFARRTWGVEEAAVAAIAFLSMPLTIAFARTVIFDSALAFFVVVATLAFYLAVEEPERQRRWALVAYAAMGFGVLTKGPVAIALPLLVAVPYSLWRRRVRALGSLIGLALFAAIIAPWVWGMERAIPGFLRYVMVTETAQRLATKALKRTGPPWYFIPYLLGGALPWAVTLLTGWRRPGGESRDWRTRFLLLALFVPLVFFSLSQSKRPQYILPLMAPVALLVAQRVRTVKIRPAAVVVIVLGVLLIAAPFLPQFSKGMKPVLVAPSKISAFALGVMFIVCGAAAALLPEPRDIAIIALSAPMLALPLLSAPIMDAVAERRSTRSFVEQLTPHLQRDTQVIGVEAFSGSMAFYLGRPMIVATDDAEEFTSNYLIRHYAQVVATPGSPVRPMAWFRANLDECCRERVYVIRNNDRANAVLLESRGMRILAEGSHNLAYGPWRGPNTMPDTGVDAGR